MAIVRRLPFLRFNWHRSRARVAEHAKSLGLAAVIALVAVLWGVDWGRVVHVENQSTAGAEPLGAGQSFVPVQDAGDMAALFDEEKRAARAEELPAQF